MKVENKSGIRFDCAPVPRSIVVTGFISRFFVFLLLLVVIGLDHSCRYDNEAANFASFGQPENGIGASAVAFVFVLAGKLSEFVLRHWRGQNKRSSCRHVWCVPTRTVFMLTLSSFSMNGTQTFSRHVDGSGMSGRTTF